MLSRVKEMPAAASKDKMPHPSRFVQLLSCVWLQIAAAKPVSQLASVLQAASVPHSLELFRAELGQPRWVILELQ